MSSEITHLLQVYLEKLQGFYDSLLKEKECIEQNNLDNYLALIKTKESIIKSLSSQYQHLESLAKGETLEKFILTQIKAQAIQGPMQKLYQNIKTVTASCEHQNEINGMLITASKNITERMLDMITGRNQNRTYSKHAKSIADIESTKSQRI